MFKVKLDHTEIKRPQHGTPTDMTDWTELGSVQVMRDNDVASFWIAISFEDDIPVIQVVGLKNGPTQGRERRKTVKADWRPTD